MTRRELMALAARLGIAGAALPILPVERAFAQAAKPAADDWGKVGLIRHSARPPDYETPVALLDRFITPIEHFYVRSHMPVPTSLDAAAWALQVDGEVDAPITLSVEDLRQLPARSVTMTLECAGNGRAFFDPPVAGLQWTRGAVGTGRWTGASLADILSRAKARASGRFVHMHGADRPLGTMPDFVRQVPIDKAMDPDTIVAYELNGQPIPPVHGFPLRAIVPGWEGAYSLKWLNRLQVSATPSDSFWVASGYRFPTKRVAPGSAVAPEDMAPLMGMAVKTLITTPLEGATAAPGSIKVGGFAWSGGGEIKAVDISVDHGVTWRPATLSGEQHRYAWRRFDGAFEASTPQSYLILSRATDSTGAVQPAVAHWNPSGYLWNAYDQVRVTVKG
jgi:DMSO/TMAO reductase YedYZ molybdopterin-dependent catalytic subunit